MYFCRTDNWNKTATPYKKLEYGKWELHLPPNADGSCPLRHLSEVKIIIKDHNNQLLERLSPWAAYVTQPANKAEGTTYKQRIWHPENVILSVIIMYYLDTTHTQPETLLFPPRCTSLSMPSRGNRRASESTNATSGLRRRSYESAAIWSSPGT